MNHCGNCIISCNTGDGLVTHRVAHLQVAQRVAHVLGQVYVHMWGEKEEIHVWKKGEDATTLHPEPWTLDMDT